MDMMALAKMPFPFMGDGNEGKAQGGEVLNCNKGAEIAKVWL